MYYTTHIHVVCNKFATPKYKQRLNFNINMYIYTESHRIRKLKTIHTVLVCIIEWRLYHNYELYSNICISTEILCMYNYIQSKYVANAI